MSDYDGLFQLMKTPCEYWLGARSTKYQDAGTTKQCNDDVVFFSRPRVIVVLTEPELLPFKEVERLSRTQIEANIFLSSPKYPPFQYGIEIGSFYRLVPVENVDINGFLDKARALASHSIWEYEEILKSMQEPKETLPNQDGSKSAGADDVQG